tara:strand:- start:610 stop:1188 length:579 start_codon:yes stop_codon:yes gene_type:complete
MANFILKPTAGTGNQLVLQNQAGNAIITTGNNATDSIFPAGHILQVQTSISGALFQTTTAIPEDDTIPQNTEGGEFCTIAFTPRSATSTILIDARMSSGKSGSGGEFTHVIAIFKDSVADAIAVGYTHVTAGQCAHCTCFHTESAGSTSARTYKMRVGSEGGDTLNVNAVGGTARVYGGVSRSGMVITEIAG